MDNQLKTLLAQLLEKHRFDMTASQELVSINMVETMVKHQQTFHKEKKKHSV